MEFLKKQDNRSWGVLVGIIITAYIFFSNGEFSFIFTLAGTVQAFGFALIVLKIRKSRSVSGLSRETFICYAIIFTIRSIIFIFYKVSSRIPRDICLSIPQGIPYSNFKKCLQLSSATISCMQFTAPSEQATTKMWIPSRATI